MAAEMEDRVEGWRTTELRQQQGRPLQGAQTSLTMSTTPGGSDMTHMPLHASASTAAIATAVSSEACIA